MAFNDIHLIDRNPFADGLSNNPKSKKAEKEKKGKNILLGNNLRRLLVSWQRTRTWTQWGELRQKKLYYKVFVRAFPYNHIY